jgi:acyl-CoA thioesterase-1
LAGLRRRRRGSLAGLIALILLFCLGPAAAAEAPLKLLAFGDSLVHGYGLPAGQSFPEQLEMALRARGLGVTVINGGNSGDTSAGGRARLDWALADRPDIVLVELGANDSLRGIEPSETYRNLDAILGRLAAEGMTVLLTGMRAPRNLGRDYVTEFDQVFPRLAEKHAVAFYPFFGGHRRAPPAGVGALDRAKRRGRGRWLTSRRPVTAASRPRRPAAPTGA